MSTVNHVKLSDDLKRNNYYKEIGLAVEKAYDKIVEDFNINNDISQEERYAINAIIRYHLLSDMELTLTKKALEIQLGRKIGV